MSWTSEIDKGQLARLPIFIVVVGIVSAFTSILLCLCVNTAYDLSQRFPWTIYLLPAFGLISLALYNALKLPYDYSTDDMVWEMRENKPVSPTLAPAILVGTCLSTLGGGSVGKESSAFQMGASISTALSRLFKLENVFKNKEDRDVFGFAALMGMAATFSALFFAPLGAAILVFELTRFKTFSPARLIAIIVACLIAASIAYPFGIGDIIPRVAIPDISADLMLQVVLIGTIGGILGGIFGASLRKVRAWERNTVRHPYISVLVAGMLIVALTLIFNLQSFEGGGMNLLRQATDGSIGSWDFAIKAGLVFLALAFGFKGGEIMPTLVIGGLLGCSIGQVVGIDPSFATAIGVMTFFAGMTRCPIAAFFLGFEVFGVEIIPFLLVGIFFSYFASHDWGYYGRGVRLEAKDARHQKKYIKQFLEKNPSAAAAINTLEQQSNERTHEKEMAARKEILNEPIPQVSKVEAKHLRKERAEKREKESANQPTKDSAENK